MKKQQRKKKSKAAVVKEKLAIEGVVMTPAAQLPSPPTTALTTKQQAAIMRREYSTNEIALIKNTLAKGTTDLELQLFLAVCKERNLSPITRQIHCIKYKQKGKDGEPDKETLTIQTGIDGYRAIAERSGKYAPSEKEARVEGAGTEDLRVTMWVQKFSNGKWFDIPATAYFREFVQAHWKKEGTNWKREPVAMWKKMPINQLTKCAEALALRKAFPEELGGLYVHEELDQLNSSADAPSAEERKTASKTEKELGVLTPSQTPNRGHDKEGMQQTTAPAPQAAATTAPAGECAKRAGKHGVCKKQAGHAPPCDFVFVKDATDAAPAKEATPEAGDGLGQTVPLLLRKIDPRMKRVTAEQQQANKEALARGEAEKYHDQPYLIIHCEDQNMAEFPFHVWDKNLHESCARALNKNCIFMASKSGKYFSVSDIVSVNGVAYKRGEDKVSRPVTLLDLQ